LKSSGGIPPASGGASGGGTIFLSGPGDYSFFCVFYFFQNMGLNAAQFKVLGVVFPFDFYGFLCQPKKGPKGFLGLPANQNNGGHPVSGSNCVPLPL